MSICLKIPTVPAPTLPSPLGITPPDAPSPPTLPEFCCKLPPVSLPLPPIPIPAIILNPAVITALNANIEIVTNYINSLQLECPIE